MFEIEKNEDSSYEEVDSLDMTNRYVPLKECFYIDLGIWPG